MTDKPSTQTKTTSKPKTVKKPVNVSPAKPAEPSPAPAQTDDDAAVFQQGRTAALGSISQQDAPYDPSDAKHAVWLKGHQSVA
jgi:hypothetical protein